MHGEAQSPGVSGRCSEWAPCSQWNVASPSRGDSVTSELVPSWAGPALGMAVAQPQGQGQQEPTPLRIGPDRTVTPEVLWGSDGLDPGHVADSAQSPLGLKGRLCVGSWLKSGRSH